MTLHQLRIFVLVAKHLNIGAAAAELHIVPPSVSKQLTALEKQFNRLFHVRVGHKIELTQEGRLFLQHAEALVEQADRLEENFHGDPPAPNSSLTVGGSPNPSATFLPSALARFKRKHPRVALTLKTGSKPAIEQMVIRGELDIGAVNNAPRSQDVVKEPFRREKLMAFVFHNHRLAKRPSLDIAELSEIPLVIMGQIQDGLSATEEILSTVKGSGLKLNIAMHCQSPYAVRAAVKNGMGIGLLFEGLIVAAIQRGAFKSVKIKGLNLVGQSYIFYHKHAALSEAARNFLELLRQERRKYARAEQ